MKVTINDAAQRLNVSPDSVRRRLKSGVIEGQRDHRGQWWLDLPDDVQAEPKTLSVDERMSLGVATPLQRNERESLIIALEDQIDDLKARLDRAEAERREEAEQFRKERDRLLAMIEKLTTDRGAK
jgi:chaperonin cofactor prefoldin